MSKGKVIEQSKLTTLELKKVLNHIIQNNKALTDLGEVPVAINIIGDAGLAKTSVSTEVGLENGFKKENIVKLNLSQLDEVGDLIGVPLVEYQMTKKEGEVTKGIWVKTSVIPSKQELGYTLTNNTRMGYAEPEWIVGKTGPVVLLLDDYSRASQRFTQAVMELISTQSYMSWSLPKGSTIILTSNPDDGMYNVSDQDPAQQSRMLNVHVKFDAKIWANWAEKAKLDGRGINFVLMHPDIVGKDKRINARSITLFLNSIRTIPNFEANLDLIQCLAEGSLGTTAATMFASFIHNKLDKMITPQELLDTTVPFDKIKEQLDTLINGEKYRGDIANAIVTRLTNHVIHNVKPSEINDKHLQRVKDLILTKSIGTDLRYVFARNTINFHDEYNVLLQDDTVMDMVCE